MSRAWWSSSQLSDGACPTEREPVLSCCTAGISCYFSGHGQPPRTGTQQDSQCLSMATSKSAPSTKDTKVLGHVESRSMGDRDALSLGGQMKQCSAKGMGEAGGQTGQVWMEQAFLGRDARAIPGLIARIRGAALTSSSACSQGELTVPQESTQPVPQQSCLGEGCTARQGREGRLGLQASSTGTLRFHPSGQHRAS